MHHFLNFIDSIKPLVLMVSVVSITGFNTILTTIGLLLSIGYGIRKFYILEKNEKQKNKQS